MKGSIRSRRGRRPWLLIAVAITAALAVAAMTASPASADSQGPVDPSAASTNSSIGTQGCSPVPNCVWQNPANAEHSDNADAYVGLSGANVSDYLTVSGFGFTVPSNATITGVTAAVERHAAEDGYAAFTDASVKLLVNGSPSGTDHADLVTHWPVTDTVASYGSGTDTWGASLTPSVVNASSFGLAVASQNITAHGSDVYVDDIQLTVYYSSGGSGTAPANTAAPTVSGVAQVGQTLTTGTGTWSGTQPITYTYAWLRCDSGGNTCSAISGASSSSYVVQSADVGSTLRSKVTASNAYGQSSAQSAQTAVVTSGGSTSYTGVGYYESKIYDPSADPYTAFVGLWSQSDGLWTAFTQAGGTKSTAPTWVQSRFNSYGLGTVYNSTTTNYDQWNLTKQTVYMRSIDHGATWQTQTRSGTDDMVTPDSTGAPGSSTECSSTGSGAGCSNVFPSAFYPQADFALSDGTLIRRVNGEDLDFDNVKYGDGNAVQATAFLQRLAPGATHWSGVQYLESPSQYTYQVSRIRQLSDGRLIALGQRWDAPAGSRTSSTTAHLMLWVSSNQGTSWSEGLTVAAGSTEPKANEWDVAELPNGNLLAIVRDSASSVRFQALLLKNGTGWQYENIANPPFTHSGHPELLATKEGAVLYLATNDTAGKRGIWYITDADAEAGNNNWKQLPFTPNAPYTGITSTQGGCTASGSNYNCSTFYYPRSIEDVDGTIVITSHVGGDDPYPPTSNEAIYVQTFKLQGS